jgi:hypothetical protein
MHDAELWNVEAPTGKRVGQAVLVSHWQLEDGTHCGPKAPIVEGDVSAAGIFSLQTHITFCWWPVVYNH